MKNSKNGQKFGVFRFTYTWDGRYDGPCHESILDLLIVILNDVTTGTKNYSTGRPTHMIITTTFE